MILSGGFESGFEGSAGGGGQTREHAQLARSLGIEQLAVVVSKLDTCDFSQQRFLDIQAVLLPFLKGCGFRPSSLQWLPAVGPSGQNLAQSPSEPQLSWFKVSLASHLHVVSTLPLPMRLSEASQSIKHKTLLLKHALPLHDLLSLLSLALISLLTVCGVCKV